MDVQETSCRLREVAQVCYGMLGDLRALTTDRFVPKCGSLSACLATRNAGTDVWPLL